MEFLEELPQPRSFSDTIGNSPILCLSARARDGGLPLRRPRNETVAEEDGITRGGAASIWAAGPISISVDDELCWRSPRDDEAMLKRPLERAQDSFGSSKMNFLRIMHVKTDLLDNICNVGPSECQVLKSTHEAGCSRGRLAGRRGEEGSRSPRRLTHVEIGETKISTNISKRREQLLSRDELHHELEPFIETLQYVEYQGAIADWFTKVSEGISHALHLAAVVINRKIALVEVAKFRIEEQRSGLTVP